MDQISVAQYTSDKTFIGDFSGEVPGASAKDCGNYLDMNLPMANYWGAKYAALLENIEETRLVYPE